MDICFRESVHYDALTFKLHFLYFLEDIQVVSYILSCSKCLASAPDVAPTAGADAARRQNGFAILLRASARGVVHLASSRST
jgi:hypothetical protein